MGGKKIHRCSGGRPRQDQKNLADEKAGKRQRDGKATTRTTRTRALRSCSSSSVRFQWETRVADLKSIESPRPRPQQLLCDRYPQHIGFSPIAISQLFSEFVGSESNFFQKIDAYSNRWPSPPVVRDTEDPLRCVLARDHTEGREPTSEPTSHAQPNTSEKGVLPPVGGSCCARLEGDNEGDFVFPFVGRKEDVPHNEHLPCHSRAAPKHPFFPKKRVFGSSTGAAHKSKGFGNSTSKISTCCSQTPPSWKEILWEEVHHEVEHVREWRLEGPSRVKTPFSDVFDSR